jgi:hypothetical protein
LEMGFRAQATGAFATLLDQEPWGQWPCNGLIVERSARDCGKVTLISLYLLSAATCGVVWLVDGTYQHKFSLLALSTRNFVYLSSRAETANSSNAYKEWKRGGCQPNFYRHVKYIRVRRNWHWYPSKWHGTRV